MQFATGASAARWIAAIIFSSTLSLTGCGELTEQARATEESNMKRLAILYGQYLGPNRGRPPREEAALKKYIESKGEDYLQHLGVNNVDELFVSERDGQPYVVYYGKLGPFVEKLGGPISMYEQVGADGYRFAASELGTIERISDEEFQQMVPDAK